MNSQWDGPLNTPIIPQIAVNINLCRIRPLHCSQAPLKTGLTHLLHKHIQTQLTPQTWGAAPDAAAVGHESTAAIKGRRVADNEFP